VEKCAFDERMDSGLRLEKWDLMCNLLEAKKRRKFILFRTPMEQYGGEKANKRQRDQMEFIFLAFSHFSLFLKQGGRHEEGKNLSSSPPIVG
jgi:hypothetical protein